VQAFTNLGNGVLQSDGSPADTQSAINASAVGGTVLIPAGSFTWTSGVTVNKPIKIQGAGSSSFFGFSTNAVGIGMGAKTFTIQTNGWLVPQVGQGIQALFTANGSNYMQGTVISFNGSTLVMDVTSTAGSGTRAIWTFATLGDNTVITDNTGSGNAWNIVESPNGPIEISGIHDIEGTATGDRMLIGGNGRPVLIHDCRFSSGAKRSTCIRTTVNCGIVYRCSFDSQFYAGSGAAGNPNPSGNDGIDAGGMIFQNANDTGSWSRADTMGARDMGGTNNFYVEDCYFACIYLRAMDISLNSRVVVRRNILDHSGLTGHGNDTGPYGARHAEYYDNVFHFVDIGIATVPLDYFMYIRGGTGCIFSNVVDNPFSQEWGQKSVEKLTVEAVDRSDTGNSVPLVSCPTTYPVAHQVGQGFNGANVILDPLYVWSNTGTGGGNPPFVYDGAGKFNSPCPSAPPMINFILSGRDYLFGSARPAYSPYTYPHPLRADSLAMGSNQPPVALARANSTNGIAPLMVTFSSAGSYDPEGTPLTYNWVFGDGTSSTQANPLHTYPRTGRFSAQLFVSDGTNFISSAPISITATPTTPTGFHIVTEP
jgi:hypothetical protein